jgi:hypothetical protein
MKRDLIKLSLLDGDILQAERKLRDTPESSGCPGCDTWLRCFSTTHSSFTKRCSGRLVGNFSSLPRGALKSCHELQRGASFSASRLHLLENRRLVYPLALGQNSHCSPTAPYTFHQSLFIASSRRSHSKMAPQVGRPSSLHIC